MLLLWPSVHFFRNPNEGLQLRMSTDLASSSADGDDVGCHLPDCNGDHTTETSWELSPVLVSSGNALCELGETIPGTLVVEEQCSLCLHSTCPTLRSFTSTKPTICLLLAWKRGTKKKKKNSTLNWLKM